MTFGRDSHRAGYDDNRSADRSGSHLGGPYLGSPLMRRLLSLGMVLASTIWLVVFIVCYFGIGYKNPYTSAGQAGYVTRGAIAGQSMYVGVQYGPASTGAGWLLDVTNVPTTPHTFEENFSGIEGIVSGDNTRIGFAVDVMVRLRTGAPAEQPGNPWIKIFFDKVATMRAGDSPEQILKVAYDNNLKQPIRGIARISAEQHAGLDIQDNMAAIRTDVTTHVQQLTANTPWEVLQVTVGRIHYPDQVTNQVVTNLKAEQIRLQKVTNVTLVEKQAQKDIIDNEGLRAAADIINEGINPRWLRYKALEAKLLNIMSANQTEDMIPVDAMGVPVTKNDTPPKK